MNCHLDVIGNAYILHSALSAERLPDVRRQKDDRGVHLLANESMHADLHARAVRSMGTGR